LKSSRKFDEHLGVELAALVYEGHTNTYGPNHKGSHLSELYQETDHHLRLLAMLRQTAGRS
jgi:hypothetical protein